MNKVRYLALKILQDVNEDAYSNLLLNQVIKENKLERNDTSLLTEIVYGTLQHQITLDFYLDPFIKNKKMKRWVRNLLRLSLYQLVYLDKIPKYAIINEAVNIAKKRGGVTVGKFVNGVLRNIERTGVKDTSKIKDKVKKIEVETSHPRWLVEMWIDQFGIEKTNDLCKKNNERPNNSARINTSLTDIQVLKDEIAEKINISDGVIKESVIFKQGNIAHTGWYKEGKLSVQDESSMLVAHVVNPSEGDYILDCCAAPGGKSTHIAEMMNNSGKVIANDIHEHKINLINNYKRRLHLTNIEVTLNDASKLDKKYEKDTFDKILVDAPCSGLGVLQRKPEIRYNKTLSNIKEITNIQRSILDSVIPLLKSGGTLVYSTCTINKAENEDMIEYILSNFKDMTIDKNIDKYLPDSLKGKTNEGFIQILPIDLNSDGFFISRFIKK